MRVKARGFGCRIEAEQGEQVTACAPNEVRDLLRQYAWIYFSGFGPSLEDFDDSTSRFGRSAPHRRMPETSRKVALGFHAENSYNPWRPDTIWFLSLAVGTDGGNPTDVLDGVQLLDDMDERWNTFSLENDLCFTQTWSAEELRQALNLGDMSQVECFLRSLNGLSCDFINDDSLCTRFVVPMVVPTQTGQRSFSSTMLHAIVQQDFYGMTLDDGSRSAGLRRPRGEARGARPEDKGSPAGQVGPAVSQRSRPLLPGVTTTL